MTKRLPCPPAPARWRTTPPSSTRCSSGSRSAAALWLSARAAAGRDRNKTMTCLAGAEPIVGAQPAAVQGLQWFVSESTWDAEQVSQRRLELLWADPATAPHDRGALVVDDSGDARPAQDRPRCPPVPRLGRQDRQRHRGGLQPVADERVDWPAHVVGYTPASRLPRARVILGFGPSRSWPPTWSTPPTRPGSGSARWWPTAATATTPASPRLGRAGVAYVLAVKPPRGSGAGRSGPTPREAAAELAWVVPSILGTGPRSPAGSAMGTWRPGGRRTRGGLGPARRLRLVVATTDPPGCRS